MTYSDDGFESALAVRLVTDVVVGSDESHARVLHPVDVVFVRHHEHQADPEPSERRPPETRVSRLKCGACAAAQSGRPSQSAAFREAADVSQSCLTKLLN